MHILEKDVAAVHGRGEAGVEHGPWYLITIEPMCLSNNIVVEAFETKLDDFGFAAKYQRGAVGSLVANWSQIICLYNRFAKLQAVPLCTELVVTCLDAQLIRNSGVEE